MKRGFFQIIIHLKAAKVASLLEYSNDYELDRFSNSGKVWEFVSIFGEFPTQIDVNHPRYHIYYRE